MFFVLWVAHRLEKVLVAAHATHVLWRACTRPCDAQRILKALVWCEHLLSEQLVSPAVSEIVFVDEPLPLTQKMLETDLALVLKLRTSVLIKAWITNAPVMHRELV